MVKVNLQYISLRKYLFIFRNKSTRIMCMDFALVTSVFDFEKVFFQRDGIKSEI